MDLSTIILILTLAFNFIISVWNCYASGFNAAILQKQPSDRLRYVLLGIVNGAGLLFGFAGAAYVVAIVLSFITYSLGYITLSGFTFVLAFNFVVFGTVIVWFGIIITIHSVAVLFATRSWRSLVIAGWNTFASTWNAVRYLRNFGTMFNFVKEEKKNVTAIVALVIVVAVGIAVAIAYAAYHMGFQRGRGIFTD
jgi:hypothetical protein